MSQTKAQLLDNIKDNVQLDAQKALRFADSDSSHYVAFRAPGTVSSSVTWTLPAADGSANYVLATDGSGNLSWIADPAGQWVTSGSNIYFTGGNVGIGDNSPSNPLSVTGASAFNGDVQFTGASYNVTWDKSVDDLIFNDNAKACFGTGSDLQIYHDGSHSQVKDTGSGGLHFWSGDYRFYNAAGSEFLLRATEDGEVQIYHDNGEKLNTVTDGINLTGSLQFGDDTDTHLSRPAANQLAITTGGSERVRFDSSGRLGIGVTAPSRTLDIQSASNENGFSLNCIGTPANYFFDIRDDGTVVLRVDSSGNLLIPNDSAKLYLGADNDLEIYHNGSHAYLKNTTGNFHIGTDGFLSIYGGKDFGETCATFTNDGSVDLYYDNTKRIETTSSGVTVIGNCLASSKFRGNDSVEISLGDGEDLVIEHDGTNSTIINKTGRLIDYVNSNEIAIDRNPNGSVDLYHDGTKKFGTTSSGCDLSLGTAGDGLRLYSSGNVWGKVSADVNRTNTSGGMLSLQGLWNGSQVNIIELQTGDDTTNKDDGRLAFYTRQSGSAIRNNFKIEPDGSIEIPNDSQLLKIGAGNDLQLYHDGTDSWVKNWTGKLNLTATSAESGIIINPNGAVELYYNNVLCLETHSEGIQVKGGEGISAVLQLLSDEGDDNADHWEIRSNQDENDFEIRSKAPGSFTAYFKLFAYGPMYHTSYSNTYASQTLKKGDNSAAAVDFVQCRDDNNNLELVIEADGDVKNANNSYGSTSDAKLKENIVDAGSQWADIKAVKVRNFNFKADSGISIPTKKHIGVVAQEIETVSPGLISESIDRHATTGADLGTKTKGVRYSVLYMKAVKALQEAMARIETLETKVAALESA